MTIFSKYGKPERFTTITANPQCKKIKEQLLPGQQPNDRPDIVSILNAHQ